MIVGSTDLLAKSSLQDLVEEYQGWGQSYHRRDDVLQGVSYHGKSPPLCGPIR